MPISFLTHKALLFARLVVRTISTYRKSGRLFILRVMGIFVNNPPSEEPTLVLRLNERTDSGSEPIFPSERY